MITQEYLKSILHYNENTGIFTWIYKISDKITIGQKAGCLHHTGYNMIQINKKMYLSHRLAYLYYYGNLPKMIDHIDRNRNNNKINNLRPTNYKENRLNSNDMDDYNNFIEKCRNYGKLRKLF